MASPPLVQSAAVVGLAGSTAVLAACKRDAKAEAEKKDVKTVRVEPVGRADIDDILVYPADLKPSAEVRVFSRLADRILAFPWKDGDEVKRGSRIAVIRTEGISQGVAQVAAQMDALDVQMENQEAELKRLNKLLSSGAIPQAEYDRLNTALLAAKAQRRALVAGKGQLSATASDGVITAAISGVVADKMLEEGDMAVPSMPLCRLISVDKLKVELRLIESDVTKIRMGQKVSLRLDAYPDRAFMGDITAVMPYLEAQTRTNTVEVTVDNAKDEATGQRPLKPGMFGKAEIVVSKRSNVLVAPEPALLLDNQVLEQQKPNEVLRKAFVVDKDTVARQRIVKLGARKGSLYEVLDGLAEGDRLVVRGQHGLKDAQQVEIVEAEKK
jgi:RND family efflux transporter MFP subunit